MRRKFKIPYETWEDAWCAACEFVREEIYKGCPSAQVMYIVGHNKVNVHLSASKSYNNFRPREKNFRYRKERTDEDRSRKRNVDACGNIIPSEPYVINGA